MQVPNGELSSEQLRRLAGCIKPYGDKGCADITTRANIQLRGVTLEDASDIIHKIEDMGLTSFMTGMDNVRNLTGSPIAGLDPHELIDVRPMLTEMQVCSHYFCLQGAVLYQCLPTPLFQASGRITWYQRRLRAIKTTHKFSSRVHLLVSQVHPQCPLGTAHADIDCWFMNAGCDHK